MKEEHHMGKNTKTREGTEEKHRMEEKHHKVYIKDHYMDIHTCMI